MKVTYRTWRRTRDTDKQGNSNIVFKELILAMINKLGIVTRNAKSANGRNIPYEFESFNIPEDVFRIHCIDHGLDYWQIIISIIQACNYAALENNDSFSDIWDLNLFLDIDANLLTDNVPSGVENSSHVVIDELGNEVTNTLTWQSWFNNGIGNNTGVMLYTDENNEERALLNTNKYKRLNRNSILAIYEYSIGKDVRMLNKHDRSQILKKIDIYNN